MTVRVAHFRTPFLSPTETFIHQYLRRLDGAVRPAVFTKEVLHRDAFPVDDLVDYSAPRFSRAWWIDNLRKRTLGGRNGFLRREFRRRDVRLIHAHFAPEGWQLLELKAQTGLPMVTTFYGYDIAKLPRLPGWGERYRDLFAQGDLFLVEGPHMGRNLAALGCPEGKIRIQRIAIDLDRIPSRAHPAGGGAPVFLFCGRFTEKKGLIYALRAFQRLFEAGARNFSFRVIGDGPGRGEAEDLVARSGLGDRVRFLGMMSQGEFYEELSRADVFVSPSVTAADGDTEGGAPTTILEAQAAGLPVVSTRHADIPDVTVPGGSALLSEERDVEGLAANIRFFLEDGTRGAAFGRAGRAHVEARHDIRKEVSSLESHYMGLIKEKGKSA